MKLSDYLLSRDESVVAFARRSGIPLATVQKMLREGRLPPATQMLRVRGATDGAVTEADYPGKRRGR